MADGTAMTPRERLQVLWARGKGWYQSHGERDRRIILGVVGAIVASLLYVGVYEPIRDHRRSVADAIEETQTQLERDSRFLGAAEGLRADRAALKKKLAEAKRRLLPGTSGTLGAAALQERANAIAKEKGVTVQSTQVMRETEVDPYRKVAVRLTLAGDLEPMVQMISGLEHGSQLSIPFLEMSRRGALPNQPNAPRRLSATMEVNGFVASSPEGAAEEGDEPSPDAEAATKATGADVGPTQPAAPGAEGPNLPAGAPGTAVGPGTPAPGGQPAGAAAPAGAQPGTTIPGGAVVPGGPAVPGVPGAPTPPQASGAKPATPPVGQQKPAQPGVAKPGIGQPGSAPAAKPGAVPKPGAGGGGAGAAAPGGVPGRAAGPGAARPGNGNRLLPRPRPGAPVQPGQAARPRVPTPSATPGVPAPATPVVPTPAPQPPAQAGGRGTPPPSAPASEPGAAVTEPQAQLPRVGPAFALAGRMDGGA